jgi:outer membrane protein assembly factor BamB/tetratricopeptide (TPR) repeat protein
MALRGDLASVDLSQVFQMLALNQKVGLLGVRAPGTVRALYFDPRGVTLCYNEHVLLDRVLVTLTRTGQLPASAVQDAREHAAGRDMSVIDSLLAGGFLSQETYEQAFRAELVEEIYDLFFWREAKFEFFEGVQTAEGFEGTVHARFFFSTDSLIMEAARRIDEWSYIEKCVPGEHAVFAPAKRGANVADLGDNELAILDLVDGKRNVSRLIEITGMRPFQVSKALAILFEEEVISPLPDDRLLAAANECVKEGRLEDAVNLLEKAVAQQVGYPQTHAQIADVYESRKDFASAAHHRKCLAEYHVAQGEFARAIELFERVIELLPTDLRARERLIEMRVGMAGAKDPAILAEGKLLVDLYLEIGELDRVQRILEGMLRQNPQNTELKKSLVNVHTRAGNTRRVIELYESIAEDLARERRPIEAVAYLQKILMIDRSRRDVSERVKALYELDERRRSRRRNLALFGVLFLVIAALCGVWYVYEDYARQHFERLDVDELLETGDYEACAAVYRSFQESYPFTLAAGDADNKLAWIESLRLANDAQIKHTRLKKQAEVNEMRERYRVAWDRYEAEFQARNLEAALQALETVHEWVGKAGQAADERWARRVKLHKTREDLRAYVAQAAALHQRAEAALAAGRWREAREDLLRLLRQYDMAKEASAVQLPVLLDSHPGGAQILKGGAPLLRREGEASVPLRTPAVVFCPHGRPETFVLVLDGFQPQRAVVEARKAAEVSLVLMVRPRATVAFDAQLHTGVAASSGWLAVGLGGGRLGIARADDGSVVRVVDLEDLSAVEGRPVVTARRTVYRTNDQRIASSAHDAGESDWSVQLDAPAADDPEVADGRVFVGDERGRLLCLQLVGGKEIWRRDLGSPIAGPPVVSGRAVVVATRAGDLLSLDVADGKPVMQHALSAAPAAAPVRASSDRIAVGTVDGRVHLVNTAVGRTLWSIATPAMVDGARLAAVGETVFVAGSDEVVGLGLADGKELVRRKLPGRRKSGPVVGAGVMALVVAQPVAGQGTQDLLVALDPRTLEVRWEFTDGGTLPGAVGTDGSALYVPNAKGEVQCFR